MHASMREREALAAVETEVGRGPRVSVSTNVFAEVRMNVPRCAGKLWTALLSKYPLDDAYTVKHLLLVRELSRAVRPDTSPVYQCRVQHPLCQGGH